MLLGGSHLVFAGPPFVTDDPEPVDYQHWEFYIASQDSELGGDWSCTAPHFEINYGAAPDWQLHLIAPLGLRFASNGSGALRLGRHRDRRKIPLYPRNQLAAPGGDFSIV